MGLREQVKRWLPYEVVCTIAKTTNRPFLEDIHRNERIIEYAWVLNQVRGPEIADVGYAGSYFAEMLCQFGHVTGIDPRDTPHITHPFFRRGALLDHPYDTVICVSVLEHLPRLEARDLIQQMLLALAPNGQLLITVPFGQEGPFRGYYPFRRNEIQQWTASYIADVPGGWMPSFRQTFTTTVQIVPRAPGPNTEYEVTSVALVRIVRQAATPHTDEANNPAHDNVCGLPASVPDDNSPLGGS